MVSQRTRGLLNTLLVCNAAVAVILMGVVAVLVSCFVAALTVEQWQRYPIYSLAVVGGLIAEWSSRDRARLRANLWERSFLVQHRLTLRQLAFAAGALFLYLAGVKDLYISRTFLSFYLPALYAGLFVTNYYLPQRLARGIFGGIREERTLLLGPTARAARMERWLADKKLFGFRTVGILSADETPQSLTDCPQLGGFDDLEAVVRSERVTQLILLELPRERERHQQLVAAVEKLGVRFLILSNLEELLDHPVVHVEDDGLRFITLREEPLENPFNRLLKRALDLIIAVPVVLLIIPPLAVLVWLLQKLQSQGPLFYSQTRAGIQNRQFQILKFRTMHVNNDDETRQAAPGDRRVFPTGRWLRRFSLDELPQFINVLRGEMSVTGPRPHLVEHNAQFAQQMANYHIRTFVKPGITGLAQVRGFRGEARTSHEIAQRLASDISYLENWRLALDLSIIGRTAWQMLQPPRTAY